MKAKLGYNIIISFTHDLSILDRFHGEICAFVCIKLIIMIIMYDALTTSDILPYRFDNVLIICL